MSRAARSTPARLRHWHYDQVDSTSDQARRLAAAHPGEPILVTAAVQTAGRGRSGRTWQSPRGGAWMSLVWPMAADARRYDAAPLVAALATLRAVDAVVRGRRTMHIKWPNDILLDGAKVAGILCERVAGEEAPAGAPHLVIGAGINADFDADRLGNDLRFPATTLRTVLGESIDVSLLILVWSDGIRKLLDRMDRMGLEEVVLAELAGHLAMRDQAVELRRGEETVRGVLRGLDPGGHLVLATSQGEQTFAFGEVHQLRPVG